MVVAGQKDIVLSAGDVGICLSLDSIGNWPQRKVPRRGTGGMGDLCGMKRVPDCLYRAEWGVQAVYSGQLFPSEACAFLASDGAENPIGLSWRARCTTGEIFSWLVQRGAPLYAFNSLSFYKIPQRTSERVIGCCRNQFWVSTLWFPTKAAIVKNWYTCENLVPDAYIAAVLSRCPHASGDHSVLVG